MSVNLVKREWTLNKLFIYLHGIIFLFNFAK
nr:MAG TPA: hypothetical protein [Caudoviricetes sp.]